MNNENSLEPKLAATPRRIVVADPMKSMWGMLQQAIASEPGCEASASTTNGHEAIKACRELRPEVVVLELALDELSGVEVMRQLRVEGIAAGVVIYTASKNEGLLLAAIRQHPHGFAHKEETFSSFQAAFRAALRRGSYFSPKGRALE